MVENRRNQIIQRYLEKHLVYNGFDVVPHDDIEMAVVIPVYKEGDYLIHTIESLLKCCIWHFESYKFFISNRINLTFG